MRLRELLLLNVQLLSSLHRQRSRRRVGNAGHLDLLNVNRLSLRDILLSFIQLSIGLLYVVILIHDVCLLFDFVCNMILYF